MTLTLKKQGIIYIVATPIGNLGDVSVRAIETLQSVDKIACEDTRHSQRLLQHFAIKKPLIALHEQNEREMAIKLLEGVEQGESLALISDAGTPLISDPGYTLVRLAHQRGVRVIPIPGPSALIAALSASGLASRFIFEGFLSPKAIARQKHLETLAKERRTVVFFEAPHRIIETLQSMVQIFGETREAVIARELTKTFETIRLGTLSELLNATQSDPNQVRGEFVILVSGFTEEKINSGEALTPEAEHTLKILLSELSLKQATSLAAKITGQSRHLLYETAIQWKAE